MAQTMGLGACQSLPGTCSCLLTFCPFSPLLPDCERGLRREEPQVWGQAQVGRVRARDSLLSPSLSSSFILAPKSLSPELLASSLGPIHSPSPSSTTPSEPSPASKSLPHFPFPGQSPPSHAPTPDGAPSPLPDLP